VLYLGIILGEVKVRAVVLCMALHASDWYGHEAIALAGIVDVSFAGAVT